MRTIVSLLAVCLVIVVAGCRKVGPTSAGGSVESYRQYEIKVNSKFFGDWFRVTQCAATKTDSGRLKATVSVVNEKGDCQLQYRYHWLDKDGVEVKSNTSIWEQKSCGSKEVMLLTGVAPELRVEDYILEIRFSYSSSRW